MILTQMSNEINEGVQLLGRIHRTGQVNKPSYMVKISSLPGEKRPLALLQKKLATLFANVSGKGESAYSLRANLPALPILSRWTPRFSASRWRRKRS